MLGMDHPYMPGMDHPYMPGMVHIGLPAVHIGLSAVHIGLSAVNRENVPEQGECARTGRMCQNVRNIGDLPWVSERFTVFLRDLPVFLRDLCSKPN